MASLTSVDPLAAPGKARAIARRRAVWIAGLLVALVPASAFANFVLNHFYVQGAFFWDTGAFAGLIWRRDVWLTDPPPFQPGSQYAYHVMPLFTLLTLASRWLPLNLPQWYAAFLGVGHALPAVAVFWLLTAGFGLREGWGLAASAVLAIVFAFTGISLATIAFPHFEIVLAGALLLTCAAIALERYWAAATWLVFALIVREDAGFHSFGILFLLIAVNKYHRRPWREQRPLLLLAATAFLYSAGVVLFKQIAFPDATPLFASEYIGNPPFGNISLGVVLSRAVSLPIYRAYFFWPGMAAFAWALRSRNILIAVGYVAFAPWMLLHLMSNRDDIIGTLSGYYAFPFLVSCAWPLVAILIVARQRGTAPERGPTLLWFSGLLVLSFVGLSNLWNPGRQDLWQNFATLPSLGREWATDSAIDILVAAAAAPAASPFGVISTDQSVHSFAPYSLTAAVIGSPTGVLRAPQQSTDTIAYFEDGFDVAAVHELIAAAHLTHGYRFTGTSILLATDRSLDGMAGLEAASPTAAAGP